VEVAKCLTNAFTLFGFPNEILLSDQGSEFVSQALEVFLKECNVKHIKASVHHPECNGSLERFHRCLKNMLKAVLHDNPGLSWEVVLPWVLFAYREVPVKGLCSLVSISCLTVRSTHATIYRIIKYYRHSWRGQVEKES